MVAAALAVIVVVVAIIVPTLRPNAMLAAPTGLIGWPAHAGLVRLDWDDVTDATSYQVRVRMAEDWRMLPGEGIGLQLIGSSAYVNGVAADSPYWFSVRAVTSATVSQWSDALFVPAASPAADAAADAPAELQDGSRITAPATASASRERNDKDVILPVPAADLGPPKVPIPHLLGTTCATAADLGDITDANGSFGPATILSGEARQSRAHSFDLNGTRWVAIALSDLDADADLYLYNDLGRRVAVSQNPGAAEDLVARTLQGGTYCLHVVAVEAGGRRYRLSFETAIPSGDQATELAAWQGALDLGDVSERSGTKIPAGNLAGDSGSVEYFRFAISDPKRLAIALTGLDAGVVLTLEDPTGGIIATNSVTVLGRIDMSTTLVAGDYLVRVQASEAVPNRYELSLIATSPHAGEVAALRTEPASRVQGTFAEIESLRLPDLVSDPPTQHGEASVVVTPEGKVLLALRFEGYVTNLGAGPLHLSGNPQLADPGDPTSHDVWQRVLGDYGDWVKYAKPPVRFETSDGHNHFHLMEIVAYSLWDTTGTVQIRPGEKVGFCLLDAEELIARHPHPGEQHYSEQGVEDCMANRPDSTSLLMGVSEGWRDIYENDVVFQWIDVSDVTPGRYRVGVEADPYDIVAESDETNNGVALSSRLSVVPGFVAKSQVVRSDPGDSVDIELGILRFGEPGQPGYRIVTQPSNGTLQSSNNFTLFGGDGTAQPGFYSNRITYTPDPDFVGVDTFGFVTFDSWAPQYPTNPLVATVTIDMSGFDANVAIDNAPASISAGASIDLHAMVSGTSPEVVWTVSATSGVSELAGTIDADGHYTAPIRPPPGGTVTIRAASKQSPSAFDEAKLAVVFAANTAPAVVAPAAKTFGVGDSVDVAVAASDAQGDTLAWSSDDLPAGLGIVSGTGRIVGNPTRTGTFTSNISVSDGQLATTVVIGWTIN